MKQIRTFEDVRKQLVGKRQERKFVATRADMQLDEETRTIEISFSSEAPVERWFGYEILDHTPAAVDLVRLNTAGPLLNNHDTDKKLGWAVPGQARIDTDRKGRTTVRFSRRQAAEDEWQDVRDGAPVTVSVGYMIHELVLEKHDEDGADTYRATKWEPLEVSLAPVPADITVGGGRALKDDDDEAVEQDEREKREEQCAGCAGAGCAACAPAEEGGDRAARDKETGPAAAPARATQNTTEVRSQKMDELMEQLTREGEFFKDVVPDAPAMAREFYAEGKKVEEFRAAVLEKRREAQKNLPHGKPAVELSEGEKQRYSISRAILSAGDGDNSFEREVSDQIGKELKRTQTNKNSIFVPTGVALRGMAMQRTPLTSGGATTGGDVVFTEPGSFIDMLRNRAKVIALGATVLPGLRGPVSFPKQTGAGTLYWTGENPGSDVTESNLTLDQVALSPKTAMAQEAYSRQLLAQSNVAADQLVTNDLVRIGALGIDRAALHGSGSSNEPTGLYSLSGVNSVAFGGAVTFPKIVGMETEIESDNAEGEMMAYLTTPNVKGTAKTTLKSSGVAGYIWEGGEMNGYRAESTNQLRKDMGGGTNEHGVVFGVWPHLYIGEWGAVELLVDPYTLAGKGLIRVIEFLMIDIAARYAESFSKGTGLTAS